MTTFVIITPPANGKIDALHSALRRVFDDSFMEVAPGQFVASKDEATSVEISQALDVHRGDVGQFAVFTVAGHHGWHRTDLWEWLRVRGTP